jgi:hypothetical protein
MTSNDRAGESPDVTLEDLKRTWTATQLDLASKAVFDDDGLTFAALHEGASDASQASDYVQPLRRRLRCSLEGLHTVAGLDISFGKDRDQAIATVAVLSFPDLAVSGHTH